MGFIHQTNTEIAIHGIMDGLVSERQACYIGFDLYVGVDEDPEMRDIRVGIHLLRWSGRILGAADDDFLNPTFVVDKNWECISTHGSCWPDSTTSWINEIINDIWKNKLESKYAERYRDDNLRWNREEPDVTLFLQNCQTFSIFDIKDVVYHNRCDDKGYKSKLVADFLLDDDRQELAGLTSMYERMREVPGGYGEMVDYFGCQISELARKLGVEAKI